MVNCAVVNCSTRSNRDSRNGVKFFQIPKVITKQCDLTRRRSERRRSTWLAKLNRKDLKDNDITDHTRVCSRHFVSGECDRLHSIRSVWSSKVSTEVKSRPVYCNFVSLVFQGKPARLFEESSPDWAPSLELGYSQSKPVHDSSRYDRRMQRSSRAQASSDDGNGTSQPEALLPTDADHMDAPHASVNADEPQPVPENEPAPAQCEIPNEPSQPNPDELDCIGVVLAESQYLSLMQENSDLRSKVRKLRDQVTDLEVDKFEMESKIKTHEDMNNTLCARYSCLEKSLKHSREKCSALSKAEDEFNKNIEALNIKIANLTALYKQLEDCTFKSLESFSANEEKVKFYTGLPSYSVFQLVLKRITPYIKHSSRYVLQPWQSLLLTLMRLRLAVPLQDTAFRFGVSVSTACRVFEKYVHAMYEGLCPLLVHWPSRETLWKTMPQEFKDSFGKSVAVIVDCFEVFTEKPSSLDTRAMLWSNYKHHHSVKVLVGITPTGAISFVSLCWGGRVSDQHVAANSGLYELLLPNDVILADRGFDIDKDVGFFCARVLYPAFTRGLDQLSSHDVCLSRKIAHLRIHVERVIGLLRRKYTILQSVLPIEMLTKRSDNDKAPIDEIVGVCCALTNLSKSIVVCPGSSTEC